MFLTVNGTKLFFDIDGEGLAPDGPSMRQKPTVVLVHGGPGADHSIAKPFFSQLTDIAQVVYYDHRGNGRSDLGTSQDWNLTQWGDDLKGLCDVLGIQKPIVIGTSFGGFVALSYATRYPDHAGGLALISTAAKVEFADIFAAFRARGGAEIAEIAQAYWTHPTDEGRALYKSRCVPFYTYADLGPPAWLPRVLWRNETALWFNGPNNEHGQFDYRADLEKIQCPVLVMVGAQDPITPPVFSDTIVQNLHPEHVRYIKYDACGHGVVGDKPAQALTELRGFIERIAADMNSSKVQGAG
ncbi:MAG: alpha/beta hydrolase [Pseudomonadota bacterium]